MIVDNRKTGDSRDAGSSTNKPWRSAKTLNWIDRMIEFKFPLKIYNGVNHLHAAQGYCNYSNICAV